jgi:hypothetical protein
MAPATPSPDRDWRAAVAEIAVKAKAKLPECNGRVDKAVAIVLNGDIELLPDGTAKVASQSNAPQPTTWSTAIATVTIMRRHRTTSVSIV